VDRRFSGERGASLLLALGFLLAFSLAIPALLRLGTTNFLATTQLRQQRGSVYAADGSTEGAIQYLRHTSHIDCARPIAGSCPITHFDYTDPSGTTAVTTWQFVGGVFDYDRTLLLTSSVGGVPRVTARVIFRDSQPVGSLAPADVVNWTYKR